MNQGEITSQGKPEKVAAIEFRNVSIGFGGRPVLDDISFSVAKGQMKIIIGLSKSGKSTILKLGMGLLQPDEGEIIIDGFNIVGANEHQLSEVQSSFGVVLQTDALFSMSVAENVAYRLIERGMTLEEAEPQVRHVLGLVGLEHAYDLMPEELSGGMSRRVAFARAVTGAPRFMFYDSPCSGLDPITSRRILRAILRQRDLHSVSSLLVTNNIDQIRYLCCSYYEATSGGASVLKKSPDAPANAGIIMLASGKIIFDGSYTDLIASTDPRIREFLD